MSFRHRTIAAFTVVLAIFAGGGCLCWITGDCEERLTPPKNPFPADGATEVPVSVTLSWEGGDAPSGQTIRHDVYLSASNPPVLYRPSVSGRTLTIDSLAEARTYYWRVILIEENGSNLMGPVWSFTTEYPPPYISVTYPNWATEWTRGETRTIQWRSSYAGSNVRLELFWAGERVCEIAESTLNDGYFDWVMANCAAIGDPIYRVKVTSLLDESMYDYSDFFTVTVPCPIEVIAPVEREYLTAGVRNEIRWRPLGVSTNVKVSLQLYQGADFRANIAPVTADDGSYEWIVSDFQGGSADNYRIRINDLHQFGCSRFSEYFSIHACSIRVTSPVTGDIWPLGTHHTITWDTTGLPDFIDLHLYHNGEFVCVLSEQVPNTGEHPWTVVRCGLLFAENYQIRLLDGNYGPCGYSGRFNLR